MTEPGFAVFDTAIGACGIAWSEGGIVAVQLPDTDEPRTRARMLRRVPGAREAAAPPPVERAIAGIIALLRGEPAQFSEVALDLTAIPPFNRRVYDAARAIPRGSTASYGEIASRLGDPGAARAVGQALGENPFPLIVPCHRVLAAHGKMGGFSAPGGSVTKRRLLTLEGALSDVELPLFDRA